MRVDLSIIVSRHQLFLFDLDGLLLQTEPLHFAAYQQACQYYGVHLTWDFPSYCLAAHYGQRVLRERLYGDFPQLAVAAPDWHNFYERKKLIMERLAQQMAPSLMPGVTPLLLWLQEKQINHVVVTNSPSSLTRAFRAHHPLLDRIPHWITREDYGQAKPSPECYELAIARHAKPEDKIIGFEDTPKGLQALLATRADAVLISEILYPEIEKWVGLGAHHYPSLENFLIDY